MNTLMKRLAITGATLSAAGFLAVSQPTQVEAATEWEARTVEQVEADLESFEEGTKYTIVWGDTLGVIATAIEMPLETLIGINNIANADLIMPGSTLHISADHSTVSYESSAGNVQSYNVQEQYVQEVAPQPVQYTAPAATPAPTPAPAPAPAATPAATPAPSTNNAKEIIAQRESNGNYNARNGRYIGRYQLDSSYLNGDWSPANQEAVVEKYVSSRYGSWDAALSFWNSNGWY